MNDYDYIESKKNEGQRDARRKYSWMREFPMTNEPLECVLLLGRLNEAISVMLALQDDYYTEYIWNSNSEQREQLAKNGFTESWFCEIEERLSLLRTILMGNNYDWNAAYENLYREMLGHEVYWRGFYEERAKTLEAQLLKGDKKA